MPNQPYTHIISNFAFPKMADLVLIPRPLKTKMHAWEWIVFKKSKCTSISKLMLNQIGKMWLVLFYYNIYNWNKFVKLLQHCFFYLDPYGPLFVLLFFHDNWFGVHYDNFCVFKNPWGLHVFFFFYCLIRWRHTLYWSQLGASAEGTILLQNCLISL